MKMIRKEILRVPYDTAQCQGFGIPHCVYDRHGGRLVPHARSIGSEEELEEERAPLLCRYHPVPRLTLSYPHGSKNIIRPRL